MKIIVLVLLIFLIFFSLNLAQNKNLNDANNLSVGAGFETNNPTYGVHALLYYKDLTFGFTYILPISSETGNNVMDIKNGFTCKIGLSPLQITGGRYVFPIYLGFAFSYINESSKALGISGDGKITGAHLFIGILGIPDKQDFFHRLGFHIELGISNWDYDDSILYKKRGNINYNYPKFYSSIGVYYFFL
jgi:hypothetical protein